MAVTIKDIAKRAGVSFSTVSRALNGAKCVNEQKREEICRLAREMGYVPNPAAVQLKKSRSGIIGLYVENMDHISSPHSLYAGIQTVYSVLGKEYSAVVKAINDHIPGSLNGALYDGILTFEMKTPQYAFWDEARSKGIPLVIANQHVRYDAPMVVLDQEDAVYHAMCYLLDKGHRRISILEGASELTETRLRHAGWVRAVREYGLEPADFPIYNGQYDYYQTTLVIPEILEQKPSAILAFNDHMASAAINYARHFGYKVPEDISVIGFDNWNFNASEPIGLTTYDRRIDAVATKCMELLREMIQGKDISSETHYIKATLVERGSVTEYGGAYDRTTP
jgi:LacI family transcriptional regulator